MTDRKLKQYALIGLLVTIQAEQDRLNKPIDKQMKEQVKLNIDTMTNEYNSLVNELNNEKPL